MPMFTGNWRHRPERGYPADMSAGGLGEALSPVNAAERHLLAEALRRAAMQEAAERASRSSDAPGAEIDLEALAALFEARPDLFDSRHNVAGMASAAEDDPQVGAEDERLAHVATEIPTAATVASDRHSEDPDAGGILVTGKREPARSAAAWDAIAAAQEARFAKEDAEARKDERLDATTRRYDGNPGSNEAVEVNKGSEFRTADDPRLRGVNARLARMLSDTDKFSNAAIVAYLKQVGIPIDSRIVGSLQQVLAHRYSAKFQQWRRANPGKPYPEVDVDDMLVRQSPLARTMAAAAASGPGTAAASYIDGITGNNIHKIAELAGKDPAHFRAALQGLRRENPDWALAGDVLAIGVSSTPGGRAFRGASSAAKGAPLVNSAAHGGSAVAQRLRALADEGAALGKRVTAKREIPYFLRTQKGREAWWQQRYGADVAKAMMRPYKQSNMGSHYFARSKIDGLMVENPNGIFDNIRNRALREFRDSRFNVARAKTYGDFYVIHKYTDPKFFGARPPKEAGRRGFSARDMGIETGGVAGRFWYGAPRPLKMVAAAPVAGTGAGAYAIANDDEEDQRLPAHQRFLLLPRRE